MRRVRLLVRSATFNSPARSGLEWSPRALGVPRLQTRHGLHRGDCATRRKTGQNCSQKTLNDRTGVRLYHRCLKSSCLRWEKTTLHYPLSRFTATVPHWALLQTDTGRRIPRPLRPVNATPLEFASADSRDEHKDGNRSNPAVPVGTATAARRDGSLGGCSTAPYGGP
jgi:hypothetical protein